MRRFATIVALATVVALTSSCFMLKGARIVSATIGPGGRTELRLELRPEDYAVNVDNDRGRVFVLVGVADGQDDLVVGRGSFDINGRFGGPHPLVQTPGLQSVVAQEDASCGTMGVNPGDATGMAWTELATERGIRDRNDPTRIAVAEVRLRAPIATAQEGREPVLVVTGHWKDDGDATPELGEIFCTGNALLDVYVLPGD